MSFRTDHQTKPSSSSSSCADYTVINPCIVIIPHVVPPMAQPPLHNSTQENHCREKKIEKKNERNCKFPALVSVVPPHNVHHIVHYIHTGTSFICWPVSMAACSHSAAVAVAAATATAGAAAADTVVLEVVVAVVAVVAVAAADPAAGALAATAA